MLNDLRWGFALPSVIVLGIALLALWLGFGLGFDHIGFDKRRRRRLLLLQLLDALVSRCQLLVQCVIVRLQDPHLLQVLALPRLRLAQVLQHLIEPFQYLAESLVQVGNFFFWRHVLSIADKDHSEQYPAIDPTWIGGQIMQNGEPNHINMQQVETTQNKLKEAASQQVDLHQAWQQQFTLQSSKRWQKKWRIMGISAILVIIALITSLILWRMKLSGYIITIPLLVLLFVAFFSIGYTPRASTLTGFRSKTLWDWLQLIGVVAIPVVVALVSLAFNDNLMITQQQNQANQAIANDQQHQMTLDTYLDRMSDLLLSNKLSASQPGATVRAVAEARTLEALRTLDPMRKGILLRFLFESGLINGNKPILTLNNANLSGADLTNVNLSGANLAQADLSGADLSGADLSGADLTNADLSHANLTNTHLINADLYEDDLDGAYLINADLYSANLTDANLSHADLVNAQLITSGLRGANLIGANLTDALLQGSIMIGADLSYANLTNANLVGADLSYANLLNARITSEQLAEPKALQYSILPDGKKHP